MSFPRPTRMLIAIFNPSGTLIRSDGHAQQRGTPLLGGLFVQATVDAVLKRFSWQVRSCCCLGEWAEYNLD